jgi:hypothetical protein
MGKRDTSWTPQVPPPDFAERVVRLAIERKVLRNTKKSAPSNETRENKTVGTMWWKLGWVAAIGLFVMLIVNRNGDTASSVPMSNGSGGLLHVMLNGSGDAASSAPTSNGSGGIDSVESVTIKPADPTVEVLNGALPSPITFVAKGKTKGGSMIDLSGEWSFDRADVARIDQQSGALVATGTVGGKGIVTFKSGSLTLTTSVSVKLHYTDDPQSIDPAIKHLLGQVSAPESSLSVLYPYDKTVFPRGLAGPTIQWNGGNASDVYYIHVTSPTFEFESWTTAPPPSRYDFPKTPVNIWEKLTESAVGEVAISIQRHDGFRSYRPVTRTWTIAPANLTGSIYFWEVNNGSVVRLRPGDTKPEDFFQKPAGTICAACHSVTKNGSTMVATFSGSASPWGTFDSASGASLFVSGTDPNNKLHGSGFQAITPNGKLVLWGQERDTPFLSLSAFDSNGEIAQLNPGTGFPVYPAWSNDGKKIAFAVRSNGNWLDFNKSTLWVTDVDNTDGLSPFAGIQQIVDNDVERPTVTFPTWSPDSKWIAFERATQSRPRDGISDIWLVQADGMGAIALDNANGTGLLQGLDANSTYEPNFMPIAAGGYFWLVMVGKRAYGNTLTDVSRRKQLWVTAIDTNPLPGQDPSHPAFWLPGQELNNNNMRGEWALSPCKMLGESCSAGIDCCAGFCRDDGNGNLTCSEQSESCSQVGEACQSATGCCDPKAPCIAGFCATGQPG